MTDRVSKIILRGDISDLQAKMVAAGKSVKDFGSKVTSAEKDARKMREGLTSLGNTAGKIGLGAAAGVGIAIKAFADFDQGMSKVAAATHASNAEMKQLTDLAIQAGAATAFSATEAANGIEQLSKAGVSTADILGGGLQGALDLAAAGTVDVGYAAETAATAMTQFGLSGEQVPHIADLLSAAAGKAQGEVSDFAAALNQSGLVANQVGLSLEETSGALAAFASAGLQGSDAGTSFKTMLLALVPKSEEAGKLMDSLGFSAFDAQGNFVGLAETAQRLQETMKGLTNEQRQSYMQTIFGTDAIRASNVLYEQGADGIQSWIDKVNDQGYAAQTAAIKMDNLAGDFEKLKGSLSTLLIETGENGNSFLRGAVQNTEDFVNALANMPPVIGQVAFSMGSIVAVLGGGLWFGSKVINGVSDTRAALAALNLTAGQTALLMNTAKTAASAFAAAMAVQFVDTMDDADLSMRRIQRGFDDLQVSGVTDAFNDLSFAADTLGEALQQAAYNDLHILDSADEVKKLDEALAGLADTDLSEARDVFTEIIDAGTKQGIKLDALINLFPQYEEALKGAASAGYLESVSARGVANALEEGNGASARFARGLGGVTTATGGALIVTEDLTDAIAEQTDTMDVRKRNRDYEQSIDDFTDAMKQRKELLSDLSAAQGDLASAKTQGEKDSASDRIAAIKDQLQDFNLTLDEGKQAGRDWNTRLEAIATNATNAAVKLEGMDQVNYLNNARRDFIDLATKITGSRTKARELADELGLLHHKKVTPEVTLKGAQKALRDIAEINYAHIANKSFTVTAFYDEVVRDKNRANFAPPPKPKIRRADGGYISGPGTATSDSIPAYLSNGEYVIRAAAVDRYGVNFLHELNRMRFARGGYVDQRAQRAQARGYAAGGYVAGAGIDYDRLAATLAGMRPLYGNVHLQPHNYSEFTRQMDADHRANAIGAVTFS